MPNDPTAAPQMGLGVNRPNLLIQYDNEKGYEFRVQLEVIVKDPTDGMAIAEGLAAQDANALARVKEIVSRHVSNLATTNFRNLINSAFDENIARLRPSKLK